MNPRSLKRVGDMRNLNINLENCVFLCFMLHNYITMNDAENIKLCRN